MIRILLTGKSGQLGNELQRSLSPLGIVIAPSRSELNLVNESTICRAIRDYAPDIIVNAAGYTNVDKTESEPDVARQINAVAPGVMAEEARKIGALLVHFSTDYIFDGTKGTPYVEDDAPNPLNAYGRSKLNGERAIVATGCKHLILRASWIYSGRGNNFVLTMLRLAREKRQMLVVEDQVGSPSWAKPLADSTAEIISQLKMQGGPEGVYHLSASDYASRFAFAKAIVELAKRAHPEITWAEILATTTANYPLPARRPLNAATSKMKIQHSFGVKMATWHEQLALFMQELRYKD